MNISFVLSQFELGQEYVYAYINTYIHVYVYMCR